MIGTKVCIVGGPAGRPVYRRIADLNPRGITCRLAMSDGLLLFSWDGWLMSGPASFRSARIDRLDIDRLRRGDDMSVLLEDVQRTARPIADPPVLETACPVEDS